MVKIISVRNPWAYLIVAGYKNIENTGYNWFCCDEKFAGIAIPDDLPRGAIVGAVTLAGVVEAHGTTSPWFEGPYGFLMTDPVEFAKPIQWRGQLGIRDYTGPALDINGLI